MTETLSAKAVARFLREEYSTGGQKILDIMSRRYNIDPWSLGNFRTFSRKNDFNFFYLTKDNKLEGFRYLTTTSNLVKLTDLTFADICDFIVDCSEAEADRLASARRNGLVGILAGALSQLLTITSKDAAQILSQAPRNRDTTVQELIIPEINRKKQRLG